MNGLIVTAAEIELGDTLYEDVTFPDGSATIVPLGKVCSISRCYDALAGTEVWARPPAGRAVEREYANTDSVKVVR